MVEILARHVELVPVCPEVEVGMPVPREPVRLEGEPDAPHMVGIASRRDHTRAMNAFARRRLRGLAGLDLCGYVLKANSPSCGLRGVKVYPGERGRARRVGSGLFAAALTRRFPLLPVEEENRLDDPAAREAFLERVFAYRRWRRAAEPRWTRPRLAAFHQQEELLVRAHRPAALPALARIVAEAEGGDARAAAARYGQVFLEALAVPATAARHGTVLRRVARELRPALDARSREELARIIGEVAAGRVPLLGAVVLARHHAAAAGREDLLRQSYLNPDPVEAILRWHA